MRVLSDLSGLARRLRRDRRGTVAIFLALTLPLLFSAAALGLEVGGWSVSKVELQRRADLAAFAAAARYAGGANAQTAAGTGADLAALNGATASGRSWNAGSNTLAASDVTVTLVAGVRTSTDPAFKVVVTRTMPLTFGRLLTTQTAVTVSATAYGEVTSTPGGGPQPCILALNSSGGGVTADISVTGNAYVTATNCSIRSNSSINITGNPTVSALGIYASGSVSVANTAHVSAPLYPNSGTVPDPYANNTALNSAFSQLSAGKGSSVSVQNNHATTISPGSYSSISVSGGALTLSPGTYYVNGNISMNGGTINGSGVTIVSSGSVSMNGNATATLSAPSSSSTSGGVPGVVYATTSTAGNTINGNATTPLTGVVYAPNGTITFNGTSDDTSQACFEVIAGTVNISGTTQLATNCSSYGVPGYGSLPATQQAALVQ